MAANDVSKQWSCDRCREGLLTAVRRCYSNGGWLGGADTLVGNLILPLKSVCCSGCYSSFNNIILTNLDHAWKVHLTALYFTGIYYKILNIFYFVIVASVWCSYSSKVI